MVITETWLSVHVRSQRELSRQLSLALSPPPSSDFLKPINRLSLCQHVELALPLMRKIVKQTNVRIVFWWNKKSYTQWGNPTERKKLIISVLTVVRKKKQIFLKQIFGQVPLNCCYSAALYWERSGLSFSHSCSATFTVSLSLWAIWVYSFYKVWDICQQWQETFGYKQKQTLTCGLR